MYAYHHSQERYYRDPFGAVPCREKVVLRIAIASAQKVNKCILRLWTTGAAESTLNMRKIEESVTIDGIFMDQIFQAEMLAADVPGLCWYYFLIKTADQVLYYGNNAKGWGGVGSLAEQEPPSYQITVYQPMTIPAWFQRGVMYQIFVDRFYNGHPDDHLVRPQQKSLVYGDWYEVPSYDRDAEGRIVFWDFFGGNLLGVIKKLAYLKELGVSILYLNPIFAAPSNHKYDISDYHTIDPGYGDMRIFERFIAAAERLGMAVILDGVFSHTGSDSIYFNREGKYPGPGAFQSPDSPYYSWYRFSHHPEQYESWWGIDTLPNVDELNPSYQRFVFQGEDSVIRHWMRKGVKGWRLDVADELPDEFIKGLRKAVKEMDAEAVVIGEVWEDASHKESYAQLREYFWGDELDSVMNYALRNIWLLFIRGESEIQDAYAEWMSLLENYPKENTYALMNLIGSHDVIRILTFLGEAPTAEQLTDDEKRQYRLSEEARALGIKRLKILTLLQMTWPGVPCIYYGDEAGLEGYSDPYNRAAYPWQRENQELLDWTRKLVRLRREYEMLATGEFQLFFLGKDVLGFRTKGENEEIIVLVNRSRTEGQTVQCTFSPEGKSLRLAREEGREIRLDDPSGVEAPGGEERTGTPEWLVIELLSGAVLATGAKEGSAPAAFSLEVEALSGKAIYIKRKSASFVGPTRSCGVLLHISSLPSPWECGDLGAEARAFVDFLVASGQGLWQILPINPPGAGNSPYQSLSVFAGNEQWISLEDLVRQGLLSDKEVSAAHANWQKQRKIALEKAKQDLLKLAYARFLKDTGKRREDDDFLSKAGFERFKEENRYWLEDYALYRILREENGGLSWQQWKKPLAARNAGAVRREQERRKEAIDRQCFGQYVFFAQWQALKTYANRQGIQLIGDLPIYIAEDSCDAWVHQALVTLDEEGKMLSAGGVPPDYFSAAGQYWGNPLYRWEVMEKDGYAWWKERIGQALKTVDFVRLDHFRGFEGYWEIDAATKNAAQGYWLKGPGKRLFEALEAEFGSLPLIAEDLGYITPEVHNLRNIFGLPGMRVLQFEEPGEEREQDANCVYYSGTHDNDTLVGWLQSRGLGEPEKDEAEENHDNKKNHDGDPGHEEPQKERCHRYIEEMYGGDARWVMIPMQDLLALGSEARMNIPGTVGGNNWHWQMKKGLLTKELRQWLKALAERCQRTGDA
ncbi:MAG: bifunctional glycogen debranching protein GlgX/4-alpha-glucanotransferase [Peptococcaceae bacterium]|jgi:4-alpha-glucanotransferase|nr:bifunctional glycogen debranching protein GlgX/4-alpha-glucanotransferase [Peptococcaceae bacterium]